MEDNSQDSATQTSSDTAADTTDTTSTDTSSGATNVLTGDTTTDGQGDQAADSSTDDGKGKEGAPEAYAEFTLPEGVKIDAAKLEQALPIFKELNLTQEQAQKLIDLQTDGVNKANEAFSADKATRLQALKSDKEIGGDNFAKSSEMVGRALNTFLSAEEQQDLGQYIDRFGTNTTLVKLMYRVAKGMTEDTKFEGGNSVNGTEDRINSFYSTMQPK